MSHSSFTLLNNPAKGGIAAGRHSTGFTLIELLVVIAILAILATAIVVVINPVDLIKQSRDSTRLTDLNAINKALGLFDVTNPDDFTGTSTIVYTSLPDTSSTCSGMTPPSGYLYNCVTSSTLSKTDGTGWLPVAFSNISYGSPIGKLPVDPTNSSTTGQFYTYIMGGSWELNALLESDKFRQDHGKAKSNFPGVLAVGSNLNLSPVYSTNGLIAYYPFNDGSGTTLADLSGNSRNGTITPGSGGWTTDQNSVSGRAYSFDGTTTTINAGADWIGTGPITISVWVYVPTILGNERLSIVNNGRFVLEVYGYGLNRILFTSDGGTNTGAGNDTITYGSWFNITVTRTSGGVTNIYKNGLATAAVDTDSGTPAAGTTNVFIGNNSGNSADFEGRISDMRIFNRVLSMAEIKAIYNATY